MLNQGDILYHQNKMVSNNNLLHEEVQPIQHVEESIIANLRVKGLLFEMPFYYYKTMCRDRTEKQALKTLLEVRGMRNNLH